MEPNPTPSPTSTPKTSSGLAIAGLVLGVIAAATSFLPIINNLSAIIAFVGAVLAVIALIGARRGKHTAKGMSIAGVVLCVVSFAIVLATQSCYSSVLSSAADKVKSGSTPVSATSGDSSSESTASESSESAPSSSSSSEPAVEVDYSSMAVGQTVTLEDGLSITVNSFDHSATKYDGTPLLKANVTYTNNGTSSASFNIFDWKCEDANGAETSFYYSMEDGQLDSGKLKAGGTVTGDVYFEGEPVKIVYYSNILQSESSIAWVVS